MNLRKTISLFIFFVVCFSAFSQEEEQVEKEEEIIFDDILKNDVYTEHSIFIINSFNYNVKGITLPFVLNTKAEFKKGEEITGKTHLVKFIKDKRQLLINERVLKDNARIDYTIGEITDGKYPVDLEIYVEDTWNVIALPYPKYDSNYGLSVTIKARDYNFLGSMQPFRVDLGYKNDQEGRTSFSLMLDSGLPFQGLGVNWFFDFDNYFDYRPELSEPFYFKNRSALSVDIPINRTNLNLWFAESFIWNEENADSNKPTFGDVQKGFYMSSYPSISWRIPTGLEIGDYGELTYTPTIYATINHEFPSWPLSYDRIGPFYYFSHSLYFGRINWMGNFRQGLSLNLSNSYSYNVYYAKVYEELKSNPWSYYYSITGNGHLIIVEDLLGISSRLSHRHWIKTYYEYAGDVLRGVFDREIHAEYILSLNLDLDVRALRIKPYEWFPGVRLMRALGFDLHLNPFFDIAWYKDPNRDTKLARENLLFGSGFEMIIYPHRFRSMFLRISVGWDVSDIAEKTPMEIFLGMELFY